MHFNPILAISVCFVFNFIGSPPTWGQTTDGTPSCETADCLKLAQENPEGQPTTEPPTDNRRNIIQPNPTRLRLSIFGDQEGEKFFFGIGKTLPDNTALKGRSREPVVQSLSTFQSAIPIIGFAGYRLAENQRIVFEGGGDTKSLGGDLSYGIAPTDSPGIYSVNIQSQRGVSSVFGEGFRNIDLSNGDDAWVHRYGGGVEYARRLGDNFNLAVAVNYERVSIRDSMFSNKVFKRDQLGNRLTVSGEGQDDLVTIDLAGLYSNVDHETYPTSGTRIRVGVEQALPIGEGSIIYTRIAGNASYFMPLNLFKSTVSDILVFNVQAGTYLGDVPPYDAFSLGGSDSIRGYSSGEVSSGRTFIQGTVEYRSPPFLSFSLFGQSIDTRGILFLDYGTDLGSQYSVVGQPGIARDKPGWGLGYGFGVHLETSIGLFRIESGWGNRDTYTFVVTIGDRF
jgi:outer membrane protein insertion porin family